MTTCIASHVKGSPQPSEVAGCPWLGVGVVLLTLFVSGARWVVGGTAPRLTDISKVSTVTVWAVLGVIFRVLTVTQTTTSAIGSI